MAGTADTVYTTSKLQVIEPMDLLQPCSQASIKVFIIYLVFSPWPSFKGQNLGGGGWKQD